MTDKGSRSIRSVRLDEAKLEAVLDRLDDESDRQAHQKRRHERFRHRVKSCVVQLTQPGSSNSTSYLVPTRELSATGVSFLHGGFVHTNTRCTVQLITSHGTWAEVNGMVVRCRHVEGLLHEVGVLFDEAIIPADFCSQAMKTRMLLADDDPSSIRLARFLLDKLRAEVDVADNGEQAVEKAQQNTYDAILMDIEMPVMDGLTATRELRKKGYSGTIVALTARTQAEDVQTCLEAGFDDYLPKPLTQQALSKMIEKLRKEPLLSSFRDDPAMSELIDQFVDELPKTIRKLEEALAANDMARLESASRSIKGDAGGYGFEPITEAAAALESALMDHQPVEKIQEQLTELINWCMLARSSKRAESTAGNASEDDAAGDGEAQTPAASEAE